MLALSLQGPASRFARILCGPGLRRALAGLALACSAVLALPSPAPALPPIHHVFIIVLENENADTSFGASSPAPYLARQLTAQGAFVSNYFGTAHQSNPNYIALVSGQGPNPQTQADCQIYSDFLPGTMGADGQATGSGCVYPSAVQTVANQLEARGLSWRGYMEDMGNSTTDAKTCRHPTPNGQDSTQNARVGDQYAARHNPFIYFHSIVDNGPACDAHVVPLDLLAGDLRSAQTTPNYVFITPNLCHDGHDASCVDGQTGGLAGADHFLSQWVPQITASPAFADGVVMIVFDESASGAEACCAEQASNSPNPGATTQGPGGGRVGAVLLSPYIRPGTRSAQPYNHYSLLRTVEDFFGLGHLGYAGVSGLAPFGPDIFNGPAPSAPPSPSSPSPRPAPCGLGPVPARTPLARGTLISSARVVRAKRRRVLVVALRHRARITVVIRVRGQRTRRLHGRDYAGCGTYRFRIGSGPGTRVTISAAFGHVAEHRRLRG